VGLEIAYKNGSPEKTLGKDAIVLVLLKYVHPSEHIRNKYVNPLPKYLVGTSKCTVLHQKVKKISGKSSLPNLWMGIPQ